MRSLIFILLLLVAFAAWGCSSGSQNPSHPGNTDLSSIETIPVGVIDRLPDGSPSEGFGLMGIYTLNLNSHDATAELNPIRRSSLTDTLESVDITYFLHLAPCTDCAKMKSVSLDADGNLVVSIGIKHPFMAGDPLKPITGRNRGDLHVFNVEGIIAAQGSSTSSFPYLGIDVAPVKLVNASGYTSYLDDVLDDEVFPTDANIHPYMLHFADYSEGNFNADNPMGFESVTTPPPSGNLVMAMGCDYDYRDYIFDLDEDITYTFAIGCTYAVSSASKIQRFSPEYRVPQHLKKAASEVHVIAPVDRLKEMEPDVEVTYQVQVVDPSHGVEVGEALNQMFADSSVGTVQMEIPDILSGALSQPGNAAISGTGHDPSDPLIYEFTFANELVAPVGFYTGLVKVTDTYSPGMNASPLLNGMDGIKRVEPLINPLAGLFNISEFATYASFTIEVELGFVGSDPVADITRSMTGCAPVTVNFDASGSTDADDDPLSIPLNFEFDFDYDGVNFTVDRAMSTDPTASHLYSVAGCYLAAVRVTDSHMNTDIATVYVPIGDFSPAGTDNDITDGVSITDIDFAHSAPSFASDPAWPGMTLPTKGSARGDGFVYTAFYGIQGGNRCIFFSRSDDDGATWSTPVAVHTYDSTGQYSGCSIAADNTGQVLVVWDDRTHVDVGMEYSSDNGDNFTSRLIRNDTDCANWCYQHRQPDVAIDPGNPDNIIVTTMNVYYGGSWFSGWDQAYIHYSSTGAGGTFDQVLFILSSEWRPGWVQNIYKFHAHYAADGDAYAIAGENNNIHVFRSLDHGLTWSASDPNLHSINTIASWHRDYDTAMDPNNPEVFYVAASLRSSTYPMELYKSTDGLTVSMIQNKVNDNGTSGIYRFCPSITVNDAGVLYYMWQTNESGDFDIMADYSCNGGSSFGTDVQFNTVDNGHEIDVDLIPNPCGDAVVCLWEQAGDQPGGKLVARKG
jgi:hypothetical protein